MRRKETPEERAEFYARAEERIRQLRELAARKEAQIGAEREDEERRRARRRRFPFFR